ncbi:MAG: hypothetical protein ACR2LK_03675 [Solirubrobacteraceae bacterium]
MRVGIDGVGRLVVPKQLRDELGLKGAGELELELADGRLEMTVPDVAAHLEERDGLPVIVTDGTDAARLTVAQTRAAIERVRR